MCGGSEKLSSKDLASPTSPQSDPSLDRNMSNPAETVESKYSFSQLLELAADNDVEGFQRSICDASAIHEVGFWYCCQRLSKKQVLQCMTPLMVAAKYGSIDVVKLILSSSKADVNLSYGLDKSTALHCAASGGSINAIDVVRLLLLAGADPNVTDADGRYPIDVIVAHPKLPNLRFSLERLLKNDGSVCLDDMQVSTVSLTSSSPPFSSSSSLSLDTCSSTSVSDVPLSSVGCKPDDMHASSAPEKREYPIDLSLPDIKDSMYTSDEFRMFSFKIRPCSRAYSHDWTECPFAHPGENARRRDPKKFHYSCMPCPDFRKGACGRGDLCEYAHGVFESWLHPAQYRTRPCKDGTSCSRPVCFFAHTSEELRPLYASIGSGVPSPRLAAAMDMGHMASALNLFPGSPSAVSAMSPSLFTSAMASTNEISHSSMGWPQQNIPTLHLPGSNLQTSRLRSSISARDIPAGDLDKLQDFEMQHQRLFSDISYRSQPQFGTSSANLLACSKTVNPTNLDNLLYPEVASPRYSDQFAAAAVFSPSHRSVVLNQLQQQQSMLAPIKTNLFSPKNADHSLLQVSFGASSPGRMSPQKLEPISPMGSRLHTLAHHERFQQQLSSRNSQELGSNLAFDLKSSSVVGSPVKSWSNWESSNAKVDWSVQVNELNQLHKSFPCGCTEEPDVSWAQSTIKETPSKIKERAIVAPSSMAPSVEDSNLNLQNESGDHVGVWLEQLQLDQIAA